MNVGNITSGTCDFCDSFCASSLFELDYSNARVCEACARAAVKAFDDAEVARRDEVINVVKLAPASLSKPQLRAFVLGSFLMTDAWRHRSAEDVLALRNRIEAVLA